MNVVTLHDNNLSKDDIIRLTRGEDDTIFFIDQKERIFEFINELQLDNKDDYYFKVLRDIIFQFNVTLKGGTGKVIGNHYQSLSHLFNSIEVSKINDYTIILDTEDKDVLSDLIQQFIYADIVIDVTLKAEEERRRIVNAFIENSGEIISSTENLINNIKNIDEPQNSELSSEVKNILLQRLAETPEIVRSTQDRPIRVALLGPRRNGKSEVANCILGDNYVPTTSELITPTNCIYEKSPDGKLRVIIEETSKITGDNPVIFQVDRHETQVREFDTVDELRDYLKSIFQQDDLQLDAKKGFTIPEIRIQYNPTEYSGIPNVVLVDTPGPNIASTDEHKKLAYRWLRDADVVLFVIELQYARNKENVEFIKDVQQDILREKGKNYSLIFAANKSDLRFNQGEKPSIIRTLDRFKTELLSINLDAFVSVATSALTYNGLSKVIKDYNNDGKELLSYDSAEDFRKLLAFQLSKYQGGQNDYMLSAGITINNQATALQWYYGQEPTIELINQLSGIETLIRFTKYIADEKALYELINYAIFRLQGIYSTIETNLLAKNILAFRGDKEKVKNLLEEYKEFVESTRKFELPKLQFTDFNEIVSQKLHHIEDLLLERLISLFLTYIKGVDGTTARSKEELIDTIVTDYTKLASDSLNAIYKDTTELINRILQSAVTEKHELFVKIYALIKAKFDELNEALKKESLNLDKFAFPSSPPFSPPKVIVNIDTQDSLKLYLSKNIVDKAKGGFFHKIARWIDDNVFDGESVVQGFLKNVLEDLFDVDIARNLLRRGDDWSVYYEDIKKSDLGLVFRNQARSLSNDVKRASEHELNSWQARTNTKMKESITFVENQVERLINIIEREHENVDEQIQFLERIREHFDNFLSTNEIATIYNLKD